MSATWTRPKDVAARVRRRWDDGTLLRAYASGEDFPAIDVPLKGPRVSQIGDDLGAVQAWIAELESGSRAESRYALTYAEVGGRKIGRNRIPARARVETYAQAWALLGVAGEAARFDEVLRRVEAVPAARAWVGAQPLKALAVDADWGALLAAYDWLSRNRGTARYLREVDAAGVDTKFVERHRAVLAAWLQVPVSAAGFTAALGLAAKPATVRLRFGAGFGGMPPAVTEATLRATEAAALAVEVSRAVIVENEVTFLTLPVPERGVLLWGKGFDVDIVGALPWLREADVDYWGDLDTHGFAILDRLRAWLPQARSFLMDRATLLAFRDRWGSEPSPASSKLTRLDDDEAELYADLVGDRYGERVRLEQERIAWNWVLGALPYRPS